MTRPLETEPALRNSERLVQLGEQLNPGELDTLQKHQREVSDFIRLGRKWGFFAVTKEESEKAGREILTFAHMPESNLAVLIGQRDPESLAVLEKMIDEGLADDPKYLARLLISRIDGLYQKESEEHGTVALTAGDSAEQLDQEQDALKFLRWVNTPAPMHATPEWFRVMKSHRMGPKDLEMLLAGTVDRAANDTEVEQVKSNGRAALQGLMSGTL